MINMTLLHYYVRAEIAFEKNDIPIMRKHGYNFVVTNPHNNDTKIELWSIEKIIDHTPLQPELIIIGQRMIGEMPLKRLLKYHYDEFLRDDPPPISDFNPGDNSGIKHVRKARGLP